MMEERKFGDSGARIVIEECMTGPEVTVLAFTDGKTVLPMRPAQDHKRAYDGNQGPNTGGMGAFCPSAKFTPELAAISMETIFVPTIQAMARENRPFQGVLYFGLMLTETGPKVVEYNARFGDPETQPILALLETDLLDIFEAVRNGRLHEIELRWRPGTACCVVMASGGYPGAYQAGFPITGIEDVPPDVLVFHAGTKQKNGVFYTAGGRVLGVTAVGDTPSAASARAYEGVRCIRFQNTYYRTDIGNNDAPGVRT